MEILVPTDFSTVAGYAAKAAASIARKTGATLYFLHVIDVPFNVDPAVFDRLTDESGASSIRDKVDASFQELLSQPFLAGIRTERIVKFDRVFANIQAQVAENEIDLVVIGAHGQGHAGDFLMGSNTDKVVRGLDIPVLTVKTDSGDIELNEMVFASSFYGEVETAFPSLREIAAIWNPRMHLLNVVTRSAFQTTLAATRMMEDFAQQFDLDNYTVNTWNAETFEDGISEFADHVGADSVAIATHGFTGLAHVLRGSVAEKVASAGTLPVLTMRIKEQPAKYGVIFPSLESR